MAQKFEILKDDFLKITDTVTSQIKLLEPKANVFYNVSNLNVGQVKIYSVQGVNKFADTIFETTIGEAIDGSDVVFTAQTFEDFCTDNRLGFKTASGGSGAKSISASTYTILSTDTNKYLEFLNACVVTVPLGFAASLEFEGEQVGTGEVSFVSAATGTLNKFADFDNKTAGQFSPFGIRTKGSNVATLIGTLKLA
jgi:hypothetical protein